MSELINNQNRRSLRWQLLTTVSAVSLIAIGAEAEAADQPTLWIELGGQLERLNGLEDPYAPGFTTKSPTPGPFQPISPLDAQKPSIYSYGAEASLTLKPTGSPWDFVIGVRYGRSNNTKHLHQQTKVISSYPNTKYHGTPGVPPMNTANAPRFLDVRARNSESHMVADFKVGRDVGLGLFSTTASFGIRFAQFSSKTHASLIGRPDVGFLQSQLIPGKYIRNPTHTDYIASADNERNFHGVGPSVSWEGFVPVAGGEDGKVTFDWGVNGAVLFGRQKARGTHQESANYYTGLKTFSTPNYGAVPVYRHPPLDHNRTRSVIVPNVGGMAGISFRYPGTKISFGYRADMFFGAMDMGIDQRDTKDRSFYGPFATISIGLGG